MTFEMTLRRACAAAVMLLALTPLASQAQLFGARQQTGECGKEGPLSMPPGVDLERLKLLDAGKRLAVIVESAGIDKMDDKRRLPPAMAKATSINYPQMMRMFGDSIKSSQRFAVFDAGFAVTPEYSKALVDLHFTHADQALRQIEPTRRVVSSRVAISLGLTHVESGEDLLGEAITVEGITGDVSGRRIVLTSTDNPQAPEWRETLGNDYVDAAREAFAELQRELESRLRPSAKVLSVEGCNVGIAGGRKHGFRQGDELVIFRPTYRTLGSKQVLASTIPVAQIQCTGVGTETSQCTVNQLVPGAKPALTDYAVITNASLLRSRPR
ncbi:MAG: hypothetical protein JNJ71_19440 [Rubrivivax sp.]|nr:hypothetical protein [Rubrivivax sp.]